MKLENGIRVENISMSLDMMKDDDQKVLFSGAKALAMRSFLM